MVKFNTANLKKAVSLSPMVDFAGEVEVNDAMYNYETCSEGVVVLDILIGDAIELSDINRFTKLLQDIWPGAFIQIGIYNEKPALFIYESRSL